MTRGTSHRGAHERAPARAPMASGIRPSSRKELDVPALLGALARLKVWELARLGEISVERLIARVVRASGLPNIPTLGSVGGRSERKRLVTRKVFEPDERWTPPAEPPALEGLPGRITLEELDAIVDYWALSVTLHDCAWNVTHAAARLGIARRGLRFRWRRVRDLSPELVAAAWSGSSRPLPSLPAPPPPLAKMLAEGVRLAEIRRVAGQWFVKCTMELKGGNRTHAAENLGTTRRHVREILAAYAAAHETGGASEVSSSETPPKTSKPRGGVDAVTGRPR